MTITNADLAARLRLVAHRVDVNLNFDKDDGDMLREAAERLSPSPTTAPLPYGSRSSPEDPEA